MKNVLSRLERRIVAVVGSMLGGRLRSLPARRRLLATAVAAVVMLGGVGGGWWAYAASRALPGNVALEVGSHVVTVTDLQRRLDVLSALYGIQQPTDPKKVAQFRRDAAKAIAVDCILDDAARRRGIVIGDKAARNVLDRLIQQDLPGGEQEFVQALGVHGLTEHDVLSELKRQMAVAKLFDAVTNKVTVSDAAVRTAFTQRKAQLAMPERRQIRNIVVASRDQARQILTRLKAGGDFADLARQFSLDASTRQSGGELGLVSADELDPAYARAAFVTAEGGYFGPVQTQYGWNIGQVERVVPAAPATFAAVREILRQDLETAAALKTWRTWLAAQIRGAHVRYAAAYRPRDPDAPDVPAADGAAVPSPGVPTHSPTP